MNSTELKDSPIGRLVTIRGYDPRFQEDYECEAFVPDFLPAEVELASKTFGAVIAASSAVARADEAIALLPNPTLLVRPAIRREAVSTSALEGTYATLDEVLIADFMKSDDMTPSQLEVNNYVRAAEYAWKWVQERPVTLQFLEDLQSMIVNGTRSDGKDAGQLRTTQVFIGAENKRVNEARFVPPPPGDVLRDGMLDWLSWFGVDNGIPAVIKSALSHYQFETLHPFTDGNGRLGRLLAILQLVLNGDLRAPVVNISPWLEPRRTEYQDHLFRLSATGDFDTWMEFFATAVQVQATDSITKVGALRALQDELVTKVKAARVRGSAIDIARDLIGLPVLNVRAAADIANVSYESANNGVAKLVDLGMLHQYGDSRYERLFVCEDVRRIINS